jgi:hypothetical protein
MMEIKQDIYELFLKYGSECLWTSDSRVTRPNGTSTKTDEMFNVFESVDHKLEMIATGNYSLEMVKTFQKEIEEHKAKISEDVFELMKKAYS